MSTKSQSCAITNEGAIASDVPIMLPTISFLPRSLAALASRSASVRPPVLSSLIFIIWYRSAAISQFTRILARLVRGEYNRRLEVRKRFILPARQRLLDHADLQFGARGSDLPQQTERPSLVRIHDEVRIRSNVPDRRELLERRIAVQLDLENRIRGRGSRFFGHGSCGILKADREYRRHRSGGDTGECPDRSPRTLGFEVPQSAVDGVARSACRKQLQQVLPPRSLQDGLFDTVYLSEHALRRFAEVRDALTFTAADINAIRYLHDNGDCRIYPLACDSERSLQIPGLEVCAQLNGHNVVPAGKTLSPVR
jgi:hypothetical protein